MWGLLEGCELTFNRESISVGFVFISLWLWVGMNGAEPCDEWTF